MGLPRTIPASVPPPPPASSTLAPQAASRKSSGVKLAPSAPILDAPAAPSPYVRDLLDPEAKLRKTLTAATQLDPETSYTGPGSGVIPTLSTRELGQVDVGRDMGAVSPETGEYDVEQADPLERVLPARIDQATRDRASGLLTDRSLRDIFSHGDQTTWVLERQQQLLNNELANKVVSDEERASANERAYWRAVDELATLATVGYTGAFPLPLDKRPKNSSTWELLTDKKVEVVGKDKDGNLVLRHQDGLTHAIDVLSIPQNLISSTGIPERAIQAAFGRKPGAKDPDDPDYGREVLAERRTFSDMARDADPQSTAAKALLYGGAFAGDVLFPDMTLVGSKVLKPVAKGVEALAGTSAGIKALDATRNVRAAVGLTSDADSLRLAEKILGLEEAASRVATDAVDDLMEETPAAERARDAAAKVDVVQAQAKAYSEPLARELERRALAATSGALARAGDDVVLLAERAASDGAARGTVGLLRSVASFAKDLPPAQQATAQAIVDAVQEGRLRAARSIVDGLRATTPAPVKVPQALTAAAQAAGLGTGKGALRAAEEGAKKTLLVLDDVQTEQLRQALPGARIPDAGQPITMQVLADADSVSARAKQVEVAKVEPKAALAEAVKPVALTPGSTPARAATWIADAVRLPLRGGDEAAPYLQAGLTRAIREATIRGQRAIGSVVADAGKLKDEAMAAAYLDGVPLRVKDKGLVSSGQSHLDLFRGAVELRLAGAGAVRELSRAWIKDDVLARLVAEESPLLDDLADDMIADLASGAGGQEVLWRGRELTSRTLGAQALQPDGWRRVAAVVGAQGQQVVAIEELLGSGAILTHADREALLHTLSAGGTAGRIPSALERAAEAGGIRALDSAEAAQEAARDAYTRATSLPEQLDALRAQGDAADAVAAAKAKLSPASRAPTSLAEAERATTIRASVNPAAPEDLVRVGGTAARQVAGVSPELQARLTGLQEALAGAYVPQKVREDLLAAATRASARPGQTGLLSNALSLYKQGVTRGIWVVSPRYNLFNFFGDAEQTFLSHGLRVAAASTMRSAFQQALNNPLGQAVSLAGKGERARRVLSTAGEVALSPGKALEVLRTMRQQGTLRGAMEAATSVSDVNKIMDGSTDAFRLGDRIVTGKKLREVAVKGGVFDSQPAALVAEEVDRGVSILSGGTTAAAKASDALKESVQDVVEGIGERQRVGLYLTLIERGASPEEAAEGVVKALYDYRYSMSEGERNAVFRWVLPWWAWQKNAYRQMTSALLSPGGAYRVKAMAAAPAKAAEWAEWLAEGGDVDPLGVREGIMSPEERDGYHRLVAYMEEQGLDGPQMRAALLEVAPLGKANGGIESWPLMTPELIADYQTTAAYIVPQWGETDLRSYETGRPVIRVRPSDEQVQKLWDSPNASTADYYAWMLPPSMAESYFGWAGALAGIGATVADAVTSSEVTGELGTVQQAVDVVDPTRVPLVGLALSVAGGRKVVVPVSDTLGRGLAAIDAADVLPSKTRSGTALTGEDPSAVASRGRSSVKYAITNPTLALLWQSVGQSYASVDTQIRAWEDAYRDPSWRTGLKAWQGVPSADVQPAGTATTESYGMPDRMRIVPTARTPVGEAPAARPPSTDRSYEEE